MMGRRWDERKQMGMGRPAAVALAIALAAPLAGAGQRDGSRMRAGGAVLATIPVDGGATVIAVDSSSGRVFVAEKGSRAIRGSQAIRVLDATTGRIVRRIRLGADPYTLSSGSLPLTPTKLAVDADRNRVYVGTEPPALTVLDGQGRPLGSAPAPGLVAIPALDARAGRVYVVGIGVPLAGLQLDILDGRTGRLVRATPLGGPHSPDGVSESFEGGGLAIAPRAGRIFIGSMTRNVLHVVRLSDGSPIGAVRIGAATAPPVAVALDDQTRHVFVAASQGRSVYMVDARTGAVLRRVAIPGFAVPVALAVDPATRRAFVIGLGPATGKGNPIGAGPGSVAVLDTGTGALLATVGVGVGPHAVAIDVQRGRVFVVNAGAVDVRPGRQGVVLDAGSVSVLDARSGAVRATLSVGLTPESIAIDERTARAFVVNVGGVVRDSGHRLPPAVRQRFGAIPTSRVLAVPSSVSVIDTSAT